MAYDMTEIEKRLQLASSYRTLLDMKFFEKNSDVNELVEQELKEFVHGKLETVLGVRPSENPAVFFTSTEALTLKALARKLMSKADEPEREDEEESSPEPKPEPIKVAKPKQRKMVKKQPKTEPVHVQQSEPEKKATNGAALAPNIVVEDGRTYEIVEVGGKPFAKDITKQVKGSDTKPMPQKAQFEQMMYMSAMQELANMNSNPLIGAAANVSLMAPNKE